MRKTSKQRSISKGEILPNFKRCLKELEANGVKTDDMVEETYENYIFTIDGEKYYFFKMGKYSQCETILKSIELKNKIKEFQGK